MHEDRGTWMERGTRGRERRQKAEIGRGGHFGRDKSCPVRDQACRKCGKIGHFQIKCTQGNQNGGKKFEKGKSGSDRGSNWSGRDVGNEANSAVSETFSARQSPDFAFAIGQTSSNLNSDNEVVTLNVVGVDLPNALIDFVATCESDGLANLELVES